MAGAAGVNKFLTKQGKHVCLILTTFGQQRRGEIR